MAADASGLLDAVGIDQANIFGVSMGGMISQEFAINYPDKVINLILGCTQCGGKLSVLPTQEALEFLFSPEVAKLPVEERARQTAPWLWTREFMEKHPEAVDAYVAITAKYPTPPHGFSGQSHGIVGHDTCDRLPQIKAPTLVIVGDADRLIPPENSRILASRIPNAEMVIVKNAGHGFTEAPEATTAMLDFLKRHPRGKK